MIRRGLIAALAVCALQGSARAETPTDGEIEAALRAAQDRAAAGDPSGLDRLEEIGARRPATRWSDDAWRATAVFAERAHDLARARRALEQVIATTDDERIASRARGDLARIAALAGDDGEWSEVAARHDRLVMRSRAPGDPVPALRELEALVRAHPGYPRAAMAMIALAQGWERDGEAEHAIGWLREATHVAHTPADKTRAVAELARALVRHGELAAARHAIEDIDDRMLAAELNDRIAAAEMRRLLRWLALALLCAIAAAALVALKRATGGWSRAARALASPPTEAVFVAPVVALLAAVAQAGNPLVARAIVAIAIIATGIAWVSGTLLERRAGSLRPRGILVHGTLALVATIAAVYMAIDREQMIDLVIETWRGGPAMR